MEGSKKPTVTAKNVGAGGAHNHSKGGQIEGSLSSFQATNGLLSMWCL
jgi:hypothetical protein